MFKKYDAYKDSGIDWVGKIPAHWNILKLGSIFEQRNQKVSDKDYPALSVTKNGIVPQLDNAAKTKDGDNRKLVLKGDFVINSRSDRKGSSGLSSLDGSVSLINIVLKPRKIEPKFSHHLMKCNAFIEEYYRVGRGIVADLWTTRFEEMKTMNLALPSVEEQRQIADFLDQRLVEIDQAIAIKEQQISLLNERKQIVIQKAVTQGLNPNVAMKDSGVEWIGRIPEHWDLLKLKNLALVNPTNTTLVNSLDKKASVCFLAMESVETNGTVDYSHTRELASVRSGFTSFVKGDVLVAKITPCFENGKGAYLDTLQTPIGFGSTEFHVLRVKKNCDPKFLYYVTKSHSFMDMGEGLMIGSAGQKRVPTSFMQNYVVAIPDIATQIEIVNFIDQRLGEIAEAIDLQKKQIEKLKEYKTTLINDAVTGKIKVA